jgi:hypothetical protein
MESIINKRGKIKKFRVMNAGLEEGIGNNPENTSNRMKRSVALAGR